MSALQTVNFTQFVESSFTGLLAAPTRAMFDNMFDATFASDMNVTFNGEYISGDTYRERFWGNKAQAAGNVVGVYFKDAVEVSQTAQTDQVTTGQVGVFFDALVSSSTSVGVSMQLSVVRTESSANVTAPVFVDKVVGVNEISAPVR